MVRLPAAVFIVGVLSAGGCLSQQPAGSAACLAPHEGSTPLQQVVSAREAYVGVLAGLNAAHRLGYLDTAAKQKVEPYRASAAETLDRMEAAALAGDAGLAGGPFALAVAEFNTAMAELSKAKIRADQTQAAVERVNAARSATPPAPATPAPAKR